LNDDDDDDDNDDNDNVSIKSFRVVMFIVGFVVCISAYTILLRHAHTLRALRRHCSQIYLYSQQMQHENRRK